AEAARDPDAFPGRGQSQPHPPGEPGRAGAEARVPSAAGVERADQLEQARSGGVEMRRQLGDLVAEPIRLRGRRQSRWNVYLHGEALLLKQLYPPIFEPAGSSRDE